MIKEYEFREDMFLDIPKNGIGCELGVCRGYNAVQLYQRSKPKKLFLVDRWIENDDVGGFVHDYREDDYTDSITRVFEQEINENKVVLKKGTTIDFLTTLNDNELDWVYIDASHFYEDVINEINQCLKKVRKGGLIMGHDFHPGDPQRTGVIRPVIEAIQKNEIKMIGISSEKWASYMCEVL